MHRTEFSTKKKDRLGKALIVASLVFFLIIAGWGFLSASAKSLPDEYLCPREGPSAGVAFLFDVTDELSLIQRQSILNDLGIGADGSSVVGGMLSELPLHAKVALFHVQDVTQELPKKQFAMCNPGSGENLSQIYSNPRLAKERWLKSFIQPLSQRLSTNLGHSPAATSPILESIQAISVGFFNRPELREKPKRLIVVSDLVQNSKHMSQLNGVEPFDEFKQKSSYKRIRTDLRGVEVSILYVRRQRSDNVQGAGHVKFWEAYLVDNGASFSERLAVKSVEG